MSEQAENKPIPTVNEAIANNIGNYDTATISGKEDPKNVTDNTSAVKSGKLNFSKDKLAGVVRLNKKPLILVFIIVGLALSVMMIGLGSREQKAEVVNDAVDVVDVKENASRFSKTLDNDFEEAQRRKRIAEMEAARKAAEEEERLRRLALENQNKPVEKPVDYSQRPSVNGPSTPASPIGPSVDPMEAQRLAELAREEERRKMEARMSAMNGDMRVELEQKQNGMMNASLNGTNQNQAQGDQGGEKPKTHKDMLAETNAKDVAENTNIAMIVNPITKNVITAGSVIPSALVTAMNSDMPGSVFAMVTTDVRDSINGTKVLIPKGAKIIGKYDSNVSYGVTRSFVIWSRIVFPDATSYAIRSMAGADLAGNVGLEANVDNHWGIILKAAALSSLFSGVVAYTTPTQSNMNTTGVMSPQERASAQFGQTLNQTSMQVIQRELQVKPTLTVPVGYAFNVLVDKDLYLEKESSIK